MRPLQGCRERGWSRLLSCCTFAASETLISVHYVLRFHDAAIGVIGLAFGVAPDIGQILVCLGGHRFSHSGNQERAHRFNSRHTQLSCTVHLKVPSSHVPHHLLN